MSFQDIIDQMLRVHQEVFSEEITFHPLGGSDFTLTAIYDKYYKAVDPATGAEVMSSGPAVGIRVSDVVDEISREPAKGDTVTVRSIIYRIHRYEPDGRGDAKLILHDIT